MRFLCDRYMDRIDPTSASARLDNWEKFSSALCALVRCFTMFTMWSSMKISAAL